MVATYIYITILLMITISISLLITHIPFVYEWRLPFQKNQRLPAARRGGFGSWWTSRQVFCAALGTTRSRWSPLEQRRNETPGKSTNGWESLRNSKILIALRNFCLFMFQRLKPGGLGSCATKGRSVGESLALCAFGRPENGGFSSKEVNF